MKLRDLIQQFEEACPISLRYKDDPVGLQVGDPDQEITRVLVSLDVRPSIVKEAIENKIDLIFSHHPLVFRPLRHLRYDRVQEKMVMDLIKAGISVYSAHTNLDIVAGGMNDWFAKKLGLNHLEVLEKTKDLPLIDVQLVCSLDITNELEAIDWPVKFSLGQRDIEWSQWIENGEYHYACTVLASYQNEMDAFIHHLAHEGVLLSVDVRPSLDTESVGLGRIGNLEDSLPAKDFIRLVKQLFNWKNVRLVGQVDHVSRVAILAGDGGSFYQQAVSKGADVLITGDLYYHTSHDIESLPLMAIDPGHFMEAIIREELPIWLKKNCPELEVIASKISTDPFRLA
ncbi:Nif3-like dinuclear metal center hexameric protein [Atopobacter sp. AH10]|uniref:Nif3-like dinuclear metal center hexameric protein n=1 Tax=Atopobacter sp. AH10 TaxID=2315861 RepID=UPI000EF252C8|nr:Nif3-like dinuclear metal center hexameric protein [Atopobacter sp. AH10]RLK63193.1 Nif3-like dinuclear metal center hexameric protein [Atopobacter sp. AH10]